MGGKFGREPGWPGGGGKGRPPGRGGNGRPPGGIGGAPGPVAKGGIGGGIPEPAVGTIEKSKLAIRAIFLGRWHAPNATTSDSWGKD